MKHTVGLWALSFLIQVSPAAAQVPPPTVDAYVTVPGIASPLFYFPKIAVDPTLDHVYVMGAAGEINAFHDDGAFIGPVALTPWGGESQGLAMAVDPASHKVFAVRGASVTVLKTFDGETLVEVESSEIPQVTGNPSGAAPIAWSSVDARLYVGLRDGTVMVVDPSRPIGDPERTATLTLSTGPLNPTSVSALLVNETTKQLLVFEADTFIARWGVIDIDPSHATYQTAVEFFVPGERYSRLFGCFVVWDTWSTSQAVALNRHTNVLYCADTIDDQDQNGHLVAIDVNPAHDSYLDIIASTHLTGDYTHAFALAADPINDRLYVAMSAPFENGLPFELKMFAYDAMLAQPPSETDIPFDGRKQPDFVDLATSWATGRIFVLADPVDERNPEVLPDPSFWFAIVRTPSTSESVSTPSDTPGTPVTVETPQLSITFSSVTAAGTTTVESIDPATSNLTLPGQFAIAGTAAYEVSTTATATAPFTLCFNASNVTEPAAFAALAVLHGENGTWVDRTSSRDFSSGTVCASVPSLSPFALARRIPVHYGVTAMFDQTKAVRSGSTIPIKLQLTGTTGANVSAAAIRVSAIRLVRVSTEVSSAVIDAGHANPDLDFRYDGSLAGYVFNLSTRGLATGTYRLEFQADGDPATHAVLFGVK